MSATFQATRGLAAGRAYGVPGAASNVDLYLAGNEGPAPDPAWLAQALSAGPERIRRYPALVELQATLAEKHGVDPEQIALTAGADDGLLRCCLASLDATRNAVVPSPTFEMIQRYVALAEGELRAPAWPSGTYPTDAVLECADDSTGAIFIVSPNNPTGAVAAESDLERLAQAAPQALLVVDGAYAEYADHDLTQAALALPNAVVLRTLSKAWGLAGLRIGYAIGTPEIAGLLRRTGNPFPIAAPAADLALAWLQAGAERVQAGIDQVREERKALAEQLARLGAQPVASQANFVFARMPDAAGLHAELLERRILVRRFEAPGLGDALRITCPSDPLAFQHLTAVLSSITPQS